MEGIEWRANKPINHVLIDKRHVISILDARTCRGVDCDFDHFMVRIIFRSETTMKREKTKKNQMRRTKTGT